MADEFNTGSGEASVDSGSSFEGGTDDVSSSGNSDVELQERMLGNDSEDWYDEGLGTFVKADGEPYYDKDGNRIETKEALEKFLKTQNAKNIDNGTDNNVNNQNSKNARQPISVKDKLARLFDVSNGKNETISKVSSFRFTPNVAIKPQQQQNQQNIQNQQQQPVDAEAKMRTDYETYADGLRTAMGIEYLEDAAAELQAAGRYRQDNPVAVKLDNEIKERKAQLDKELRSKWLTMSQEHVNGTLKAERDKLAEEKAKETAKDNFTRVASQFGGNDTLEALLFGYKDSAVKDPNKAWQAGPGQELFNAIFEFVHEGEQVENINEAYNKFFHKWAKNEGRLQVLAKYATAMGYLSHGSKNDLQKARQAGIAEAKQKSKFVKPSPNSSHGFSMNGSQEFGELNRFAGK